MKSERFFRVINRVNAIVLLLGGLILIVMAGGAVIEEWWGNQSKPPVMSCSNNKWDRSVGEGDDQVPLLVFGDFNLMRGTEWTRAEVQLSEGIIPGKAAFKGGINVNLMFLSTETGEIRWLLPAGNRRHVEVVSDVIWLYGWEDEPFPVLLYQMKNPPGNEIAVSRTDGSGFRTILTGCGELEMVRKNDAGHLVLCYVSATEVLMMEMDPVTLEVLHEFTAEIGSGGRIEG